MRINQISPVNVNMYSSKNHVSKQQNCAGNRVSFKGKVGEKLFNAAFMGFAGMFYAASKLFSKGESDGRDVYEDNFDRWHLGDPTV